MARKSTAAEEPAVVEVVEEQVPPAAQPANGTPPTNGHARPAISYKIHPEKGVSIEVAIWPKELQGENGPYTVFSVTLYRSYIDPETRKWVNAQKPSWRPHELPVLQHVLDLAYGWITAHKLKIVENEPAPF